MLRLKYDWSGLGGSAKGSLGYDEYGTGTPSYLQTSALSLVDDLTGGGCLQTMMMYDKDGLAWCKYRLGITYM